MTTNGGLKNSGAIDLNSPLGAGGSALTIRGALTNAGKIRIGPDNNTLSSADAVQADSVDNEGGAIDVFGNLGAPVPLAAELVVSGAAGFGVANTLEGRIDLSGDALIQFGSGLITTIAAKGRLVLDGASAFIADASNINGDSALEGLMSIYGSLTLNNGASLTTNAGLTSWGAIALDQPGGAGGTVLTVEGALTNYGTIEIGPADDTLSANDAIHATSFDNNGGTIDIFGNSGPPTSFLAAIDISGAAGLGASQTLEGSVTLSGDSVIQFARGFITTIAVDSQLTLNGNSAFIADASTPGENSALDDLTSIAGSISLIVIRQFITRSFCRCSGSQFTHFANATF